MKYLEVAILAEIAETRGEMAEHLPNWKYYKGKLDGLMFALERTQDTEREVEILGKSYMGKLHRYSHLIDIDTFARFKETIHEAVAEYERSA